MALRVRTGLREVLLVPRRDVFETLERTLAEQLVADGNSDLDEAERHALVEGLVAGTLVAVRLDDRARRLDAPIVRPLIDPARPLVDDEQRTFLSLELVHEAGLSTVGVELEVSTASGRELHGRLGADGRWRNDDVPRGSCTVKLYDHPVLQPRKRAAGSRMEPGRDDVVWPAGSRRVLSLRAGAHHRIMVVQPPRLYTLSA
jgi:hypothetical protein